MGKRSNSSSAGAVPLIKGYLPVRLTLPFEACGALRDSSKDEDACPEDTFFFVKEHFGGDGNNHNKTLFVSNAPFCPGVTTRILLRSLLGRFGDIERVTVIENPRKQQQKQQLSSSATATTGIFSSSFFPTFYGPLRCEGKFAHVVFTAPSEMKKTLKALQHIMKEGEYPSLTLEKLELQTLQDETLRKEQEISVGESDGAENDTRDIDNDGANRQKGGIHAVIRNYRRSCRALSSRERLLEDCNRVMEEFEDAEATDRRRREEAKNAPDDDGFVTVTYSAQSVGSKRDLEEGITTTNRRKGGSKRNRKKKDVTGASELKDFYRFQARESRKRGIQDLRKKFEDDLQKVKKMKEERQYKPF